MQGKSCFNSKAIRPGDVRELTQLTKKGLDGLRRKADGYALSAKPRVYDKREILDYRAAAVPQRRLVP